MPSDPSPVQSLARVCKALGDETRLQMVALLAHGELCVCHLEKALSLAQPTASRQLAVLHMAGVVERHREGKWAYFKLARQADPTSQALIDDLVRQFSGEIALRREVARVRKACGPDACK